jgi:hypothetical protein
LIISFFLKTKCDLLVLPYAFPVFNEVLAGLLVLFRALRRLNAIERRLKLALPVSVLYLTVKRFK